MKTWQSFVAAACFLLLGGCIIAPQIPSWPAPKQERLTLAAEDGFIVEAQINGHPVRLRADTGYSGVVLNPDAAARVQLKESMFGADLTIGPLRLKGKSGVGPLTIGGSTDERRILWFEKDVARGADGVINIANLPYESVTLRLGPPQGDEVTYDLPTVPEGFWNLLYTAQLGGRDIPVRFILQAPRSLATAATGAHLAQHHGGSWSGEPFDHVIGFGVERSVRPMRLGRPIMLEGLRLDDVLVRGSDYRGRHVLPTDAPEDPSEIVVTGEAGRSKAASFLILGRDHLAGCSSLTYTGATRILSLRCRRQAPPA